MTDQTAILSHRCDKQAVSYTLDDKFPGGNIHVDSVQGDVLRLSPDLRDTMTPWFYWAFRVTNASGRTLTFVFDAKNMGVHGPAVSVDEGCTWAWLGAGRVQEGAFSYTFPEQISEVRFSVGMPYVRADWDRFLTGHPDTAEVHKATLARTPEGRDVPLLQIEHDQKKADFCVALTSRHHACEMMASYTLEGLVEGILANDESGQWLRDHVSFLIAPFMDTDGVERGDQGKNRAPHDHNRDYRGEPIYAEIKAWKNRVPSWSAGRSLVCVDFHCPALCGPVHESIFFVEPEDRRQAARMDELSECLWNAQTTGGLARHPNKLPFGCGFNSTSASEKSTNSAWSASLPNTLLGVSLEVAYANASGSEVNAESARQLGRDFAVALKDWLGRAQFQPSNDGARMISGELMS